MNKRFYLDVVQPLVKEADALSSSFFLIFVDIDQFASINRVYGNICGDTIIREIYRSLMEISPSSGSVTHMYADFYVIAMRNANRDWVLKWAEDAVQLLSEKPYADGIVPSGSLTFSVSISTYPQDYLTESVRRAVTRWDQSEPQDYRKTMTLIMLCDSALHAIKASGGNKVAMAVDVLDASVTQP